MIGVILAFSNRRYVWEILSWYKKTHQNVVYQTQCHIHFTQSLTCPCQLFITVLAGLLLGRCLNAYIISFNISNYLYWNCIHLWHWSFQSVCPVSSGLTTKLIRGMSWRMIVRNMKPKCKPSTFSHINLKMGVLLCSHFPCFFGACRWGMSSKRMFRRSLSLVFWGMLVFI